MNSQRNSKNVVLASTNQGKLEEIQAILKNTALHLVLQSHYNVPEIEETALSFVENAIIKARNACLHTQLPAIADDSGLCVRALKGEPGIYSSRYAGKEASAEIKIKKLLHALEDAQDRSAFFYCCLVYLEHPEDPTPVIVCGKWEGEILKEPQGREGFGYDPIFFVPTHHCAAAELKPEVKNRISHRGQALEQLLLCYPREI